MKTIHIACLRLLLALISVCAGDCKASAELPSDSEPTELHTDFHSQPFGKLDGRGKLLFQELYQDSLPAGWHRTLVYYPRGGKESVKLSRDVSAINVFLAAEVRRPQTARTFVKEHLTFFLTGSLGDDPGIITARKVETQGMGSDPRSLDPHARRPETIRLRVKIRPYACSLDPAIKDNGWTVDINVLTDDGAVERWLVKGQVSPLRIESFLCEAKEPNGTLLPYVRTR